MKRLLVISYYWPPSGGAGVQRWLKFVKYFREFGWEPVIYTPENPEVPANDASLLNDVPKNIEVLKSRIWEPFSIYKRFVGRKKDDKIKAGFLSEKKSPSITEHMSVWVRGNLFIPDARKFWIKPSIKYLNNYLKKNPVDAMVSTGPPHSMHLIALGLKKNLQIPWLADFRDPWTNIDFYQDLMLTGFANRKHHRLEKSILSNADLITTVSSNWAKDFKQLGANNIEVITNGFDSDDFSNMEKINTNDKFEICHLGSMNKDRNPIVLWKVLTDLCQTKEGFKDNLKISFLGFTDYLVAKSLEEYYLSSYVEMVEYKPHKEVLNLAKKSTILLLPLNNTPNVNGIIPGKLFEYLALMKPIFCIGDIEGDSARIISETQSGVSVDFNDEVAMREYIQSRYVEFLSNKNMGRKSINIDKYSRKNLTKKMAALLNQISDQD